MPKVLICDDDVEMRFIVRYFLERKKMEVVEAEQGRQAVELLQEQSFDALVIDLLMPIQDGFTTVSFIRENLLMRDLPIIVLSSMGQEENLLRALQLGATDFLKKPFSPDELYLRLTRLLPSVNN
jgi:DNA-binding response OmpR family regulator